MGLLNVKHSTYEAFEKSREETDEILEYIDGVIYMSPSPSIKHQKISSYLHGELYKSLNGKDCNVFSAPTDVLFDNTDDDAKKKVVPDLFVTCDSDNFTENELVGPPEFIIEIVSPSSRSHDMVTKLNLYMNNGVKEYWIVDPIKNHIMIYVKDHNNEVQFDLINIGTVAVSKIIESFQINLNRLFG
ncbi:Uma2 family endonuclease [Virgibacillus doumboii]|uniref:Uma2 family endonuclease n=1 Tax=Virgibacillus doumboii TaxID=2697503 RepID=UPI0013E03E3A|nr:Uma2 family endonuclease [Virgibacillus doumboii]